MLWQTYVGITDACQSFFWNVKKQETVVGSVTRKWTDDTQYQAMALSIVRSRLKTFNHIFKNPSSSYVTFKWSISLNLKKGEYEFSLLQLLYKAIEWINIYISERKSRKQFYTRNNKIIPCHNTSLMLTIFTQFRRVG